jgi:hypothetical protein
MEQGWRWVVPDRRTGAAERRGYFSEDFRRIFRRLKRTEKRRYAEGNQGQEEGNRKPENRRS